MSNKKLDVTALDYVVEGVAVEFEEAAAIWKTRYKEYGIFNQTIITHPGLKPLSEHMFKVWDDIPELNVQDCFKETNIERRRLFFQALGVDVIMKELEPILLDKQTLKKNLLFYDEVTNNPYYKEIDDVYELYMIEAKKIDPGIMTGSWYEENSKVYAVKCKCTSTGREYWIYVQSQYCFNDSIRTKPDVIRAIASTYRTPISFPSAIYRQGDVIFFEPSERSIEYSEQQVQSMVLTKDEYINLLIFES